LNVNSGCIFPAQANAKFGANADVFSIGGTTMLSFIVRVIVEQLVARILAVVIGAIL
jgi:hypothetical protein